ncbi:MAG: sensor histidine kinase [Gammaproteobacteria bacterium]
MRIPGSIRNKLLFIVLVTTFSALTLASAIFLMYDINTYRTLRVNDATTQLSLLAYSSIPALEFSDRRVASENLDLMKLRPPVRAAAIYDAGGSLFAEYRRENTAHEFPELPDADSIEQDMYSLVATSRIVRDGKILGTAYLAADFPLMERVLRYVGVLVLVALAAMLMSALVALKLQSLITKPLFSIVETARDVVATREYTRRAEKLSQDETGMLVDAFNDMLAEIENRRQAMEATNRQLAAESAQHAQARATIMQLNEQLEYKVQERTQQLQASNRELESFCYSVSHDLRGPLRSISGFTQALKEELPAGLPGETARYLDRVMAAASRMSQLIDDLLNLSRVSRGELVRQQVDLTALAREVVQDLQGRDPHYRPDVSVWQGMSANADPKLVRIVFENLLGNAWKFSSKKEKPRIVVGVMKEGAREVYFVRDNGAGFDMKYADKLFGAFQRLHGMNEFPGTGIGLATVQRIINRHGGRIWFDSAPENGASFYFTLQSAVSAAPPYQESA